MKCIVPLLILLFPWFSGFSQDAKQIVKRADDLMQGSSNTSEIFMKIHRPKWERSLRMKSWVKGDDYALIYITEPAREKGQVFLKRKREMWNWLPSINRTIKIPPSMMMQSWMGSDLTNDDLINQSSIVKDYEHNILEKEILDNEECFKIELIPHDQAPVVWGKIITWISVTDGYSLKNEYFDEDGYLVNTEIMSQVKNVGDRTIPTRFMVIPANKKDYYTEMRFEQISFNDPIDEGFFSLQNMKRIR